MEDISLPIGGEYPWKTHGSYMSYIRGGIRRGLWERSPVKLGFLNANTVLIDNTNPRSMKRFPKVKAAQCNVCKGTFRISDIEVDHIKGNHSLKSLADIQNFIMGIVLVTYEDLQLICKPCHLIKSYSEKHGISTEEAKTELVVVQFKKLKANKQVDKLKSLGVEPEGNAAKRVNQYREIIIKGNNESNSE